MIYSKIKAGVWVKYEDGNESGSILFKRKLVERKRALLASIAEIPPAPTDAELLEWAREHYPVVDTSVARQRLESELAVIEADLEQMVND
jgi:hypothetical protein